MFNAYPVRDNFVEGATSKNTYTANIKDAKNFDNGKPGQISKTAKEFTDSQGRRKVKGNMDIELTVNAMELAPHVDHIVLFSGDGDFRPLVESLQRQGVRVSVVSTVRSQPPMIADELRRQADNFIELEGLRDVVGRPVREDDGTDELYTPE